MKFGPISTPDATGHILAHSLIAGNLRLPKGHTLTENDTRDLVKQGVLTVTVAQLEATDIGENPAAAQLATAFSGQNIRLTEPFSGRVNLIAKSAGVLRVKAANIVAFNGINEAITIATLPDYARIHEGTLLATIKIIPYAADKSHIDRAIETIAPHTLQVYPFQPKTAALILTQTPGFKPSLLTKGEAAVRTRTSQLGLSLISVETVAHTQPAISSALSAFTADVTMILGASATSDRNDVAPAALIEAGGSLTRFGMPVDPGNLLFLGTLNQGAVVGLPGCARALALNGADWVLERLCADLPITSNDIAALGVGGLLKEVPARPHPRRSRKTPASKPHILLMAAGKSSRMRGENKLLREIDGEPLVVRTAKRLAQSTAAGITVVVNPGVPGLQSALEPLDIKLVQAKDADTGLAASLRAGIASLPPTANAVIIALADMPDVTASDIDALIAAHNPTQGATIIAPVAPNGKRGNPVLFDRRYFEVLSTLTGDKGAKALIESEPEALRLIPRGPGVLVDLDTPEAWADWESR